jgi:hypothetical protein
MFCLLFVCFCSLCTYSLVCGCVLCGVYCAHIQPVLAVAETCDAARQLQDALHALSEKQHHHYLQSAADSACTDGAAPPARADWTVEQQIVGAGRAGLHPAVALSSAAPATSAAACALLHRVAVTEMAQYLAGCLEALAAVQQRSALVHHCAFLCALLCRHFSYPFSSLCVRAASAQRLPCVHCRHRRRASQPPAALVL